VEAQQRFDTALTEDRDRATLSVTPNYGTASGSR
jgi:hypothetical protein